MGWQDIYKKKMQAAGLENDIRSTDDVQVFYRKEPEQYGDWRDSFMKKMEDSGLSGDIRLGQTQTNARQTVTAPAAPATETPKKTGRRIMSPGGTFLGGFSFAGDRQKTEKELADEKAQQEAYLQEYRRLASLDLDKYRTEVEQAEKKAQESKKPYNIHAFGAYNPQKTEAERDYAAKKADLNKAESIQYDIKGREALDNLTEEQTAALEVLADTKGVPAASAQADYDRKVAARDALLASGFTEDELSQLVNYQRNIPKREKNAERYAKVQEMARNEGEKSPIGGTLLSVPANLLSGIGTVYTAVEKIRNPDTPADYNSPAMLPYAYASGVRGEVTKNLQYDHGDVAAFAYGVGTSMLDSAATVALAALGVPPAAASATLGGAAATDAMVAAKERGLDDTHAIVTGTVAGVLESFFEKWSLESLIHMDLPSGTAKQKLAGMLKNTALQAGIEGSEELFTSVGNLLFDKAYNGGLSDVEQRIYQYMAGGMSYAEAQDKVAGEVVKDIAVDFGAGALAGGIMGGGNMAVQTAVQGRYQDAMQQVRRQSGVTGAYQASEDGRTTYNDTDAQIRSVVKDGKVQLESGETVDPKDVRFKDQQTADLYEGAINTAENAGAAQVFVDSYTGGDVSQYLLGMRQAYEAGRAGIPVEEMTRGTFADDLSETQRSAAYEQGRLTTEAEFPTMGDMGLGESGSAAWAKAEKINTALSKGKVQAGFTALYQAGLRRESAVNVKSAAASALPQSVQTAAYEAGLSDAAASLAREKAGLDFVSSAGSESGLVDNEYSQKMAKEQAGTAALLNTLGKNLGVRIEMVDTISGGKANGVYVAGKNLIRIAADANTAVEYVAAHEVTHRMQELAPEEYRTYRDHAVGYYAKVLGEETTAGLVARRIADAEDAGVKLTQEEAMDEIAADFTRDMMKNGKLFENLAKENRPAAKRILDALKAFIAKVKSMFRSKTAQDRAAQDAYGKSMAELEQCAALWQKAYDAAGKQAQKAKTAAHEGDGEGRYQLKRSNQNKVAAGMSDEERADIIRTKNITAAVYSGQADAQIASNKTNLESRKKSLIASALKVAQKSFYIPAEITNHDFDLVVTTTNGLFGESASKEITDPKQIMKLIPVLEDSVSGAIAIESHTNRYLYDNDTVYFHTLVGGYIDGDSFVPIRFGIKQSVSGKNFLYVVIDNEAIKKADVTAEPLSEKQSTTPTESANISIAKVLAKVNSPDIVKYVPDEFLDRARRDIKYKAIADTIRRTNDKNDRKYTGFVRAGNMTAAADMVRAAARTAGYTIRAYHGTARADRVGTVFLPERATSGPMAFFTDNRDIAANYARDKSDTSLAYDEEYSDYYTQFRVNRNGKSLSVGDLWKYLPMAERTKIKNAAPHIRFDEDYDQIIYDPTAQHGNGAYDAYELNRNRGNVLNTLVSTWLETGDLYDREADFLDVLKLAGLTDVEYRNPDARQEKVYETYLKIQNPFDASNAGQSFYDGLSAWLENTDISDYQRESAGADTWDKNSVGPELFLERVADDIEAGTSHAWTSIPDYVTAYLKELGHDGIKDTGGKGGGENHTVWIPFSSEQVKSADAVTYDNHDNVIPISERFNSGDPDIRFQLKSATELEKEVRELKKERRALENRNKVLTERVAKWRGELRLTETPSVRPGDVKKLGRRFLNEYGSSTAYSAIEGDMTALGKALMADDVSMDTLRPHARAAAEKIIDGVLVQAESGGELLAIRDHLKNVTLRYTDDGSIPDFKDWRRANRRTLKISDKGGLDVDVAYSELTEMFGEGYFPSTIIHPGDQLLRMSEVLDNVGRIYENPFDGFRDAAVTELSNLLIDGMIGEDVRQSNPTFADRQALELQETKARLTQMLIKTREGRDRQVERMRRHYQEQTKAGRERRNATALRAKIARHTADLSRKLLTPTDKQHIPEKLRQSVAALLGSINQESAYSIKPGTEHYVIRKDGTRGGLTGEHVASGEGLPTARTQAAIALKNAYDEIRNSGEFVIDPALLSDEGAGLLDQVMAFGNKRIADMNSEELTTVWQAVRAIEQSVSTFNKNLAIERYAGVQELAEALRDGTFSRKWANRKLALEFYDPYTFFSAFGEPGKQLFRTLRNAQDKQNVMLKNIQAAVEKFMDKEVYKNRLERHEFFVGEDGQRLVLTTEQIMNFCNTIGNGEQALRHVTQGGIRQPEIKRNGKQPAIKRGTEDIRLTADDVAAITGTLTEAQRKVAEGFQKIASGYLAKQGNEASMTVYGYEKFTNDNYWPIKAAPEGTKQDTEKNPNVAREIKNVGIAKARNPNANNALEIEGIYDVFARHASDMIQYSTLLAPMEDMNRLFNYRYRNAKGNLTGKTVKDVLTDVYGEGSVKYWEDLMRDVQNGIKGPEGTMARLINEVVGNAKAASVGFNFRVVIQQPTAYIRAAAILDPSTMAKGIVGGATEGNGWEKAKRYAPIASIKDTAGFDQSSRYSIAQNVYGGEGGVMEWLNDKSGWLAGKADAVTWAAIWNACEWTVVNEGGYEKGSDAFFSRVAQVFTEVIDQSQVVDGIMQRAPVMRKSDLLMKQATAFMGEPLKTLNMFMRAYDAWLFEQDTPKRSAAMKKMTRTIGAVLVTDVVNALVQSIMDAFRDDDKDKGYWERYLEKLTGFTGDKEQDTFLNVLWGSNIWDNADPLGRIPFAKDVKSLMQGYTVYRMDADVVGDFINAAQLFIRSTQDEGKKTTLYAAKQLLTAGSKIFGISVANVGRDVWAVARSVAQSSGNVPMMYEMEQAIWRLAPDSGNNSRYYKLLYMAMEQDKDAYQYIYEDMKKRGYSDKQLQDGIKKIIQDSAAPYTDVKAQLEEIGYSAEEAQEIADRWSFIDGDDTYNDITIPAVARYNEYCVGAGVSKDIFFTTWKATNSMTGEDYDGDGESDAYSKMDKQLEYINSLALSASQKRALAIACGIKEKSVDKRAPW